MKEYYKILDIQKEAKKDDIKKAYFKLVRKYPPDRYPDEFMNIREAYEILIDENTRKQFDVIDAMPVEARLYFNEGRRQLEAGDAQRAIKLLEKVSKTYSDFSVINILLGDAYMANENSGKAIQIFEELAADEPNNAGFVGKLAHAYLMRGWHKKAAERYEQALLLDEDNISLWLGHIECYLSANQITKAKEIALQGIEVSTRNGWDNIELYYHIIRADIESHDLDGMSKHLEEMKDIANRDEDEKGNVAWFLANLSKQLQFYNLIEESAAAINTAFKLLPDDVEIKKIKAEIDKDSIIILQMHQLEEEKAIDDLFKAMLEFEMHKCGRKNCLDCEFEQFRFEMDTVCNINSHRKDIQNLKNKYPELYNMKKDFFDSVLNRKNEDKLINSYRKKFERFMKICPERFERDESDGDEDYDEVDGYTNTPYVRTEVKVGRNDPCPCGSGKKYKKCCGV
ncbi:MAG: hypothetical protein A2Y23_11525 [Clostridiales bacterium GWB2_37_7]|nr:MAG: hypothetical protein A2Y23_11525 [Clostridiales bacterium GWB2_37_7]